MIQVTFQCRFCFMNRHSHNQFTKPSKIGEMYAGAQNIVPYCTIICNLVKAYFIQKKRTGCSMKHITLSKYMNTRKLEKTRKKHSQQYIINQHTRRYHVAQTIQSFSWLNITMHYVNSNMWFRRTTSISLHQLCFIMYATIIMLGWIKAMANPHA